MKNLLLVLGFALMALAASACDEAPSDSATPVVEACATECGAGLECVEGECVAIGDAGAERPRDAGSAPEVDATGPNVGTGRPDSGRGRAACTPTADYEGPDENGAGEITLSPAPGCALPDGLFVWDPVLEFEEIPGAWLNRGNANLNRPQPREVVVLDGEGHATLPRFRAAFLVVADVDCDPDVDCEWVDVKPGKGVIDCIDGALGGYFAQGHNMDLRDDDLSDTDVPRRRCP